MHSHKFYKNRKYIGNINIGNINTQAKDQLGFLKMQKQRFMRRKNITKNTIELFFELAIYYWTWDLPSIWFVYSMSLSEKLIFPLHAVTNW